MPVSIVDVSAATLVLVVILMSERTPLVKAEYPDTIDTEKIALYQARLARDRGDGVAAQALVELLLDAQETDWALRVAGEAARHEDSPTLWRSYVAISSVHAERFDIVEAYRYAGLARDACQREGADCPDYESVRLLMYYNELDAGMEAIRSGIDPQADPRKFKDAVDRAYPRAGVHRKEDRAAPPAPPSPTPAPNPASEPAPVNP